MSAMDMDMDIELDLAAQTTLVHALRERLQARLIETTISWLLLGAHEVWKLKKALRLPFVDYSSLAARRHCCAEELRLNSRLAPGLTLGLNTLTGTPGQPELDGTGPPIDCAVRMRRFASGALFSERLAAGRLDASDIDALASLLAAFHAGAPRAAPDSAFGAPAQRLAIALATLQGAQAAPGGTALAPLAPWLRAQALQLTPLWQQRLAQGHVRECHGDLHLANLLQDGGQVMAFDGIEFDPALRWIDVLDDIAFAVMDLHAHDRPDLAFRLLNGWLDHTGEHAALAALRFALVYRALVRAEVAALHGDGALAARYRAAALGWAAPGPVWLCITHGLPGSGKSHQSQRLLERTGAIRLRSDVERKRLHGLSMLASSRAAGLDLYDRAKGERTYAHLLAQARALLQAGWPVVLDAAFLRRDERERARALARALGLPFKLLACVAPEAELRRRLLQRRGDPSEADAAVLERLQAVAEPLTPDEMADLCDNAGLAVSAPV